MIQLITGAKGKGKTRYLLEKANESIKTADGHIVYIDKNQKHMYDLSNRIRLIDASRFPLKSGDEFIGFILGIAAQDHDLQEIYLDSFLTLAKINEDSEQVKDYILQLENIGKICDVSFIISISMDQDQLDPVLYDRITVSL
ncbi:MAG: twitching motility protein PilT [Lachnospiraceae bacterium]|nr:twitching motility protein PilT [Lachnospiraceae bacterium]